MEGTSGHAGLEPRVQAGDQSPRAVSLQMGAEARKTDEMTQGKGAEGKEV